MNSLRKKKLRCLAWLVAVGLALGTAPAVGAAELPAAEKVLERYAEAIGGDAVAQVKNRIIEFKFSMASQGVYATGVDYWQAPASRYLRIDLAAAGVADFETGVSGSTAWQLHPVSGASVLKGNEKRESLRGTHLNPFAHWDKFFEAAQTAGEENVGEKRCYKLVFTPAEGAVLQSYFDKDSGLLVREEVLGPAGPVLTRDLADWQESQGILSPRAIQQEGLQSYSMEVTRVSYDVEEIPEGTFDVPTILKGAAR
jgi:hypothetical protein